MSTVRTSLRLSVKRVFPSENFNEATVLTHIISGEDLASCSYCRIRHNIINTKSRDLSVTARLSCIKYASLWRARLQLFYLEVAAVD